LRTAYIAASGCYEARIECAQLQRFLELNDFELQRSPEQAGLVILYACGLTELDAEISFEVLRDLRNRIRHDSQFVVWGCLPNIEPRLIAEVHDGPTFGRREIHKLEDMIGAKVGYDEAIANHLFPESEEIRGVRARCDPDPLTFLIEEISHAVRSRVFSVTDPDIFHILVGRGCLGNCAYCSDLHACGRLESKPVERIAAEFKLGLERGFARFHLIATDLGAYGRDLGGNLTLLLDELTREEGSYKLLLPNVNPHFLREMSQDFVSILKSGKIGLLGTPVQSGSNRILKAMRRKYTVEDFKESIAPFIDFPQILLSTQVMVGFPGETREDFGATMRLLDETDFDYVQVFKFSARPVTAASCFDKRVPEDESVIRYQKLMVKAIHNELTKMMERTSRRLSAPQRLFAPSQKQIPNVRSPLDQPAP